MASTQNMVLTSAWQQVGTAGATITYAASAPGAQIIFMDSGDTPSDDLMGFPISATQPTPLRLGPSEVAYARMGGVGGVLIIKEDA